MLAVQFASFVAELTKTVICFEFVRSSDNDEVRGLCI